MMIAVLIRYRELTETPQAQWASRTTRSESLYISFSLAIAVGAAAGGGQQHHQQREQQRMQPSAAAAAAEAAVSSTISSGSSSGSRSSSDSSSCRRVAEPQPLIILILFRVGQSRLFSAGIYEDKPWE